MGLSPSNRDARPATHQCAPAWFTAAPCTLALAVISLFATAAPALTELLQTEAHAIAAGEWWRCLTGHLTHWSGEHLFWDLLMFVTLGWLCELRSPWITRSVIVASALCITTWCLAFENVTSYRGLSGIDTALFALYASWLLIDYLRARAWWTAAACGGLLTAMLAKIGYEYATGLCLFVDVEAGGFVPLVAAHLVGAVVGVGVGFSTTCSRFAGQVCRPPTRSGTAAARVQAG